MSTASDCKVTVRAFLALFGDCIQNMTFFGVRGLASVARLGIGNAG